MNGKNVVVIIEDRKNTDQRTGVEYTSNWINVYADAGMKEIILKVEGVVSVTKMEDTEYMVKLDPRYDREYVKREIEAAILTAEQSSPAS